MKFDWFWYAFAAIVGVGIGFVAILGTIVFL